MSVEIQTEHGIAVIDRVDATPAKSSKTALARLEALRDRFDELATSRLPTSHFLSLLATRLMAEPKLLQCRFDTLLRAALQCHAWGLDPTGARNGAFLIPYRDECQLQLGYGALIDLVTREGRIIDIDAQVVYEDDEFEASLGTDGTILHKPNLKSANRGRNSGVAYYAVATYNNGHRKYAVMTRQEIEDVRKKFAQNTPAWRDSFDQQALKTVIHRLCKTLPTNTLATQALQYVERADYTMAKVVEEPEVTDEQRAAVKAAQSGLTQDQLDFVRSLEPGK